MKFEHRAGEELTRVLTSLALLMQYRHLLVLYNIMYVCVYVHTCVHMHVCTYVHMHACMYAYMCVCMYMCVYVCMH